MGTGAMSLYKNLYFATLVGALAGLTTWGASSLLLISFGVERSPWIPDATVVGVLGVLLAWSVLRYADRGAGKPMRWSNLGWALLLGAGSATVAALVIWQLQARIQVESPAVFRLAAWALSGSLIAMGIGLRWIKSNRARVLHTYAGGLVGGLAGGLIFTFLGPHSPELCQAFALMLTGAGTGFGSALSPALAGDAACRSTTAGMLPARG